MILVPFRVVLDANVLYPFTLRDTLLRAAAAGLFQVYWSRQILEEAQRNLLASGTMTQAQAERLQAAMERAFPEAMVSDYEALTPAMRNDEKDRHVVAAAVKAGAQVIVTSNLVDFSELPDGVEAQSPNHFLCNLFDLDPAGMTELVRRQAAALQRPARSFEEVVTALAKMVPEFAANLRRHAALTR